MALEPKDLIGLAPFGETVKFTTEITLQTVQTFLYALCRPAAEEFGLLLQDRVRLWRAENMVKIANHVRQLKSIESAPEQLKAPPRIVHEVIESGSWCDDEQLQKMWAGLLASACTPDGKDESNLLFTDLLKRLSSAEAKLFDYACKKAEKKIGDKGYLIALPFGLPMKDVMELAGWKDEAIAKAHLEHLGSLGLLRSAAGAMTLSLEKIDPTLTHLPMLTPEQLGLQLYVRCYGSQKSPSEFFGITEKV